MSKIYSPDISKISAYLDNLSKDYPDIDPSFLDGLAKEYFGTDDPIHSVYFKRFLVSAVARACVPGRVIDSTLTLVGPQAAKKTSFLRTLFGLEWFLPVKNPPQHKSNLMNLHRCWCVELEVSRIPGKTTDWKRRIFCGQPEDRHYSGEFPKAVYYGRPFVIVITCQPEVWNPVGDRRYWVIPVNSPIPIDRVLQDRGRIWAAANALYKSGFHWYLSTEEVLKNESGNSR